MSEGGLHLFADNKVLVLIHIFRHVRGFQVRNTGVFNVKNFLVKLLEFVQPVFDLLIIFILGNPCVSHKILIDFKMTVSLLFDSVHFFDLGVPEILNVFVI